VRIDGYKLHKQKDLFFSAAVLWVVLTGLQAFAQVVITPSTPPVVNQGQTFQFTANVPVQWSMAPGSQGTVDSNGLYHAPAVVTSQQSIGGCQLLPNDHILNTRIDGLPVNSNSAAWIASANYGSLNYAIQTPVNYVDGSTPTQNLVFQYTPANNGPFTFPVYPNGKIEGGWLSDPMNVDHHMFIVNPTTCGIQEIYQYYPVGTNTAAATTNSVGGIKYQNSDYTLPQNNSVDAGGMTMLPMMVHFQEWQNAVNMGGTINHALRVTFRGAAIKNLTYLWPATNPDYTGFGQVPFGARFRLKSSYNISTFSRYAQVLLKQLQQYGLVLDDTGYDWSVMVDYTKLPYEYNNAFVEIANANITPSNFEAVDESSLEVSASSGMTTSGEVVCATGSSGTACQHVALTGVTIGLPKDQLYIQAGTGPQQLSAFVNGTSNTSVIWSMSPSLGTLTPNGLYTSPSTVSMNTAIKVTATSAANSNVSATMTVVILVPGAIRIVMSGPCGPGLTYQQVASPYGCVTSPLFVDSQGNTWQAETGDDGGNENNCSAWSSYPSTPDINLYKISYSTGVPGDMRFDFSVPNGSYAITAKFANGCSYNSAVGSTGVSLEAQGVIQFPNVDIVAAAGGAFKPIDFTLPTTVTRGQLSFVLRYIKGPVGAAISALAVTPIATTSSQPAAPPSVTVIEVK
jgi:hypothetical protein